ncbi:fatty acid-binding protein 1, liver-like [Hyperolius riggenbachi]|uniref:fatty acid-binding protein 1, liver-like n=1 Tax=Hyperolius riggenbachi TaxID=752182 RepID=UPI0035A30246
MSFAGRYELQSRENFEAFMKVIGVSDDVVEKAKQLKTVTEIQQDGNHFVTIITTGSHVNRNEFTIGEETELQTPTGGKARGTVNLEDGKLVSTVAGMTTVTEVSGDTLIAVATLKDVVYKTISKKIS